MGEVVLIALVLSVPLVINRSSRNITDVKDAVLGLGVALGVMIWLIASLARGRISWVRSRLNVAVSAFVVWSAVSIAYSRYRFVTVSEFGRLAANAGVFLLVIASLRRLTQVRRVIGAAAVVSIPICIYGFYQAAGRDFIEWTEPMTRVFSFLGNPTYLGGFFMLVAPVVVGAAWPRAKEHLAVEGERTPRLGLVISAVLFAVAGMMLVCLYYTVTLSAAIGFALGGMVSFALLLFRSGKRGAVRVLAGGLAVTVVFIGIAWPAYRRLPAAQQARVQKVIRLQDPYGEERRLHWRTALDIFEQHPVLGTGYGAFKVYSLEKMAPEWYTQSASRAQSMLVPGYAHNEYLQVLADLGVIGGAVFCVVVLGGYGLAAWVALRHRSRAWSLIGLAVTFGTTAFLFQNFFGVTFRQTGTVTFYWLWLGVTVLASSLLRLREDEPPGPRLREFTFRPVPAPGLIPIGLGMALVLAVLSWVTIRPVMASVLVRNAQGAAAAGYYQAAAALADRATEICPYSALGFYASAYAWGKLGRYDKAIAANEKALELMPGNASVYYNLGVSHKEAGDLEKARESFQRAIELMPTSYTHHAAMAEVLLAQGRPKDAERYAREAAKLAPRNPQCHLLLTEVLMKAGEKREALRALEAAYRLDPGRTTTKQNLISLLLEAGEYDRAAAISAAWVKSDPSSAPAHFGLGLSYYDKRQYAPAKEHFQRAVELDPQYWAARLNLAYTYVQLRDIPAAVAQFQYLATRAPNTSEGKRARQMLDKAAQRARTAQHQPAAR